MDAITGKRSYLNSIKSHSHPHTQKCAWRSHFNIIMCEVILRWFKDQWNQIMYLINIQCWDDSGKRSLEIFWLGRHFPITLGGHLFVTCENHLQKTFYYKNPIPSNFHLTRLVGKCLTPVHNAYFAKYDVTVSFLAQGRGQLKKSIFLRKKS